MYDNLSALNAFSNGINVSAHNIANISTPYYTSLEYHYAGGPAGTVQLQVDSNPSQFINADFLPPLPYTSLEAEIVGMAHNTVELAKEFTSQISTEHAFVANAIAIRTRDEMQQSLYEQVNGPSLVSYQV